MRTILLFLLLGFGAACSQRAGYSKDPLPVVRPSGSIPGKVRLIKTTAYCGHEDGVHRNAISGKLLSGNTSSASADWSRYPAGTVFRVVETGKTYTIDDYGPALVGTETIDLNMTTMREMRAWGVRKVHIQILKEGSYAKSLTILRPRAKRGYIRRMVRDLESKVR